VDADATPPRKLTVTEGKFVSYLRVSTQRQGQSGLGLEAQRAAVLDYLNGARWHLIGEFVEVESGKKADADRPELARALAVCRLHGATLVVAKLDRLARNAAFLLNLQGAGTDFVCADMPQANRLTVGILAVVAEEEARRISERTRAALAAAKARGAKLGNPDHLDAAARRRGTAVSARARSDRAKQRALDLRPIVEEIRAGGARSLRELAAELNNRGIPTARQGRWSAIQVKRLLERV
jgi:DNA invertase Pin-like site-specific DNA recombinase